MSRQAAARFCNQVRANPELRSRLAANPTAERYMEEGARLGLPFTSDELRGVAMAERFLQATLDDPAQYARLRDAGTSARIAEIARIMGFDCGAADLEAVVAAKDRGAGGELSVEELEGVAGGSSYFVTPSAPAPLPIPYPSGW